MPNDGHNPCPDWLTGLNRSSIKDGPLPLRHMLEASLYYPASGFDGRPVAELGGQVHSFVYADYGVGRDELFDQLNSEESGFKGYEILGVRDLKEHELVPRGWHPEVVPGPNERPGKRPRKGRPFGIWVVLQRSAQFGSQHGPERFSLLYLCADGAAAYQALYNANDAVPKALAIIQPGTGFGGNYTDFADPDAILARSVRANRSGLPVLLLHGGIGGRDYYREPIWPDYAVDQGWLSGHSIHAWSLTGGNAAWRTSETLARRNPFEWRRDDRGNLITRRIGNRSVAGKFSHYEYRRVIELVHQNGEQGTPLGASADRSVPGESVGALLTGLRHGSAAVRPLSSHIAAIARDEGHVVRRQGRGVWLGPAPGRF